MRAYARTWEATIPPDSQVELWFSQPKLRFGVKSKVFHCEFTVRCKHLTVNSHTNAPKFAIPLRIYGQVQAPEFHDFIMKLHWISSFWPPNPDVNQDLPCASKLAKQMKGWNLVQKKDQIQAEKGPIKSSFILRWCRLDLWDAIKRNFRVRLWYTQRKSVPHDEISLKIQVKTLF